MCLYANTHTYQLQYILGKHTFPLNSLATSRRLSWLALAVSALELSKSSTCFFTSPPKTFCATCDTITSRFTLVLYTYNDESPNLIMSGKEKSTNVLSPMK